MTVVPLQSLITERDAFEAVRDQIAAILVTERDNQMTLAAADGQDPALWNFRVYVERSLPWETIVNVDSPTTVDLTPIVNIWYDSDTFSESSSTRAETQKCTGVFNIDVVGFGVATVTQTGQAPGDEAAALDRDRVIRLVRQILMASQNAYLQLPRGAAWDRRIESRQSYQPRLDQQTNVEAIATRMRFAVSFNEVSPQYEGIPLSQVTETVARESDGQITMTLTYDYTE